LTQAERSSRQPFALRGKLAIAGRLEAGAVVIAGDRIVAVLLSPRDGELPARVIDAEIIAPGLIDLQVNGGFGVEVGADPAALRELACRLPETGVTAYLPTLISSLAADYQPAFAAFVAARNAPGARALGFHLEGPFLSPARKGAHPLAAIEQADARLFDALLASDLVRMVTLAPERPGALERIRRLWERDVLVSLGHTNATFEEFVAGVDAGAEMATHLYNAMSPFAHRAPGAIGAALTNERVTVGLIADGIHSHPASLQLAVRAKGVERIALISDLMAAAGMPPGQYHLGGQAVTVDTATVRLSDGTLAGAVLTLDQGIRNMVRWAGVTPAAALQMATETPARLLGLTDRGRLVPGSIADLAIFDDPLRLTETFIAGQTVFRASPRTNTESG
jgi:N-acetylglucosamine-6-phosphate deacetylase